MHRSTSLTSLQSAVRAVLFTFFQSHESELWATASCLTLALLGLRAELALQATLNEPSERAPLHPQKPCRNDTVWNLVTEALVLSACLVWPLHSYVAGGCSSHTLQAVLGWEALLFPYCRGMLWGSWGGWGIFWDKATFESRNMVESRTNEGTYAR